MILDYIKDFQIKYCSTHSITVFGSSSKELVNTSLLDYIDSDDLYDVQEEFREVIKDQAVSNRIDFTFVSPSGLKSELQAMVSYTDDGLIFIAQVNSEEILQSIEDMEILTF
ncbi:hypothetical protein K7432_014281 [Basidiobolus ranarum]|uniref:PAS domain-containing protein n=1 Tax=Basidiobolus ranarum TaxID=34480 RepID=A0ABR2WHU5_9FUNG